MKNKSLVTDYFTRAKIRLKAVQVLYDEKSWADVVRETQELVELALKAFLKYSGIEVPRIHDVSDIIQQNRQAFSARIEPHLDRLAKISHRLRRDRELAFYGSEDLTPSDFYKKEDADQALNDATFVVTTLDNFLG